MIVTDDFVLLNFPRTGSTFVREVLRKVYASDPTRRFEELRLPIDRTRSARAEGRASQHGARHQVPVEHASKPLVSVARHPLDRLVSHYELGFWKDARPVAPLDRLRDRYSRYPRLSFEQFLDYHASFAREDVLQDATVPTAVGTESLHFVRFYAREPEAALAGLTDAAIEVGFPEQLGDVRFLWLETLRADLRGLLREHGFTDDATAFLEHEPATNRARGRRGRHWRDYFSPEREADFRVRERLLFRLFPRYRAETGP